MSGLLDPAVLVVTGSLLQALALVALLAALVLAIRERRRVRRAAEAIEEHLRALREEGKLVTSVQYVVLTHTDEAGPS